MKVQLNVIGQNVQRLRQKKNMTQEQLATQCQLAGLDITRGTVAKIESGVRAVSDHEIPFLSQALTEPIEALFPRKPLALSRKARNPGGTRRSDR